MMIEIKAHDLIWIGFIVLSPLFIYLKKHWARNKRFDVFLKQVRELRRRYQLYAREQYAFFDKELKDVLMRNERVGNKMTLGVSQEILFALIDMCKFREAKRQFHAMHSLFSLDHNTCMAMIAFLIGEENKDEDTVVIIKICLSVINWRIEEQSGVEQILCATSIAGDFEVIMDIIKDYTGKRVTPSTIEYIIRALNSAGKIKEIIQLNNCLHLSQKQTASSLEIITNACIFGKKADLINEFTPELFQVMNERTLGCLLDIYTKSTNIAKAEEVYSLLQDSANSSIAAGKMMTMYSRAKKHSETYAVFQGLTSPTIVHYQLALKALFQSKDVNTGLEVFDRLNTDKNCLIDKGIYELVIKACFDFKIVTKAYELLLESIYSNIKLSKYIYEEMITLLDSSDVFGRQKMLINLYDIFKISNMASDAGLMSKFKGLIEKDIANSSLDTNESSSFKEVDQSI